MPTAADPPTQTLPLSTLLLGSASDPAADDRWEALSGRSTFSTRSPEAPAPRRTAARPSCLPAHIELLRIVGSGSMGTVWRAHDHAAGVDVAVKEAGRATASLFAALKREFRLAAELTHPGLVAMRALHQDERSCALVMEWIDGDDFDLGWRRVGLSGAFGQLAAALQAVHDAGMVHGDLKCRNVRVDPAGRVVLLDFGLAQLRSSQSRAIGGTVAYCAPEALRGAAPDRASDAFSLGVMLYRALCGELPRMYRGAGAAGLRHAFDDLEALVPGLDPGLAALTRALLAPEPADRPELAAVRAALGAPQLRAPGPSPTAALERELERALSTRADAPRYFAVIGPSGSGRARAVRRVVAAAPARLAWTRCDPLEGRLLQALDGLAEQAVTLSGGWAGALDLDPDREAAAELFPQVAGRPGAAPRALTPAARRRSAGALGRLLCGGGPLTVVLDEAHRPGPVERELLAATLGALRGDVTVIAIVDDEGQLLPGFDWQALHAPAPGLSPASGPPLAPLDPAAAAALAWCARAGRPLEVGHLERLGVPLAATRAAVAARALRLFTDGRHRLVEPARLGPAPPADPAADATLGEVLAAGPAAWAGTAARLLDRAGRPAAARDARARAGAWALQVGAFEDAVALLTEARRAGAPAGTWAEPLGDALQALGRPDEAADLWRAVRPTVDAPTRLRLSARLIDLDMHRGRTAAGEAELARLMDEVGDPLPASVAGAAWRSLAPLGAAADGAEEARLEAMWLSARSVLGVDPLRGHLLHIRHERLAKQRGSPLGRLRAASWRLWTELAYARPTEAEDAQIYALLDAHPELARADQEALLEVEGHRGSGLMAAAELAACGDRLEALAEGWQALGGHRWAARFCAGVALQARVHELPLAVSHAQIEAFRADARAVGDLRSATALAYAAGHFPVLYRTGSAQAHADYIEAATAEWTDRHAPESEMRRCVARAHAALSRGATPEALRHLQAVPLTIVAARGMRMIRFAVDGARARVLCHTPPARGPARWPLLRQLDGLERGGGDLLTGLAAALRAGLALADGDEARARELRDGAAAALGRARQHLLVAALVDDDAALRAQGFADPAGARRFLYGAGAVDLHRLGR